MTGPVTAPAPTYPGRRPADEAAGGRWVRVVLGFPLAAWQLAFFLVPMLLMVAMTLWTVQNYRLTPARTWTNWQTTLTSDVFWQAFVRTIVMAATTGVVAVALAVPFSYAIVRALPANLLRPALACLVVPFFTSYLARVFSWQFMLSDNGLLNAALGHLGLGGINLLGSPPALLVGYLTYSFPLASLIVTLALIGVDLRLEEAAKNLGHGRTATFVLVVLPALRPSLVAAGVFAAILAFGDVVTPQILGGGNYTMLGNLVVDSVKGGVDYPRAATIGVVMILTIMAMVALSFRFAVPRGRT